MPADNKTTQLLMELVKRCAENLRTAKEAQGYLHKNGITDETVWHRYRLGIGDDKLLDTFGREALSKIGLYTRNHVNMLVGQGVRIPTYDPRDPGTPCGVIVVREVQNRTHIATTPPLGLGCPDKISGAGPIVLCSAPTHALRLAQLGCDGLLIAVDPAKTLPPVHDWLKTRELVIAGTHPKDLEKLKAGLGSLCAQTRIVKLPWALEKVSPETLSVLGVKRCKVAPKPKRPEPKRSQVAELVRYAQERLVAGEGTKALARHGIEDVALIEALALGYLPRDYRQALPRETGSIWNPLRLGDTLIVPAFDEKGAPVDAMVLGKTKVCVSLFDEPRGLVAPRVASTFSEVEVVDSLKDIARLSVFGKRNLMVLRNGADAENNAARLIRCGVKRVHLSVRHQTKPIAEALRKAGLHVTCGKRPSCATPLPPETAQTVTLDSHDTRTERAVFKAGNVRYTVDATLDGITRMAVKLECLGEIHIDRFDLASDAQRRRFAASAEPKTELSKERIETDLVAILDALQRMQEQAESPETGADPEIPITDAERAVAMSTLKRPDLLETIAADLEALGWVGEADQKRILYLSSISRKLPRPLSAVRIASSGAGKSFGLELVAQLTPPEDLIHLTRLTDTSLYYHDREGLRHKLLVIDETAALTPEALTALRILQSRGSLTHSYVQRDPNGSTVTQFAEVKGPVAVLSSTVSLLDEQNLSRCFNVPVDESPAQTAAVLEAQRRMRTVPATKREEIIQRHRVLQRLLSTLPVLIPFADRIRFPSNSVKHRREQERFLNLIEASALLHQHQRMRNGDHVVASIHDFEIARNLAAESIERSGDELGPNARDLLSLLIEAKLENFTVLDLKTMCPGWTRHRLRHGLDELVRLEVLVSPRCRRGVLRSYSLPPGAESLLSAAQVKLDPLREIAEDRESTATNLTQEKKGA